MSDDGVDTTLDTLSDEQAAALCADSTEALSPEVFVEFSGYLISIATNPDDVDACEVAFEDCVDTSEPTAGGFACWVDPAVVTALPECASDITAGDLQACMVVPEECAGLQDLCPELFGTPA